MAQTRRKEKVGEIYPMSEKEEKLKRIIRLCIKGYKTFYLEGKEQ